MEKNLQDGCPHFFYVLCFGRPDPHGREIAKYGYFRPFLAQDGRWRLEKSQAENGKTQFPGARGPEIEEKKLPPYPGWLSANFYVLPD